MIIIGDHDKRSVGDYWIIYGGLCGFVLMVGACILKHKAPSIFEWLF